MGTRTYFVTVVLASILLSSPRAHSVQVTFDVASIKENKSLDAGGTMRLMPGGGIRVVHLPARQLVTIAYQLQPFQLVGDPEWARSTYYDIEAKPVDTATREQTFAMLQALLVERFRLAFHRESRQLDGFALVRERTNGLGPNLRPSSVDCEKAFTATPRCRQGRITSDTMIAVGTPIWSLLQLVISQVGAPVSDETQLTGPFDFDLRWSNEVAPSGDLPSIYTALQEQLGLKLERRRVAAEMFIVDRLERASQN